VAKRTSKALDWLLEEDQPSIRYLALRQLAGKPERDAQVQSAKKQILEHGWAADILARQMKSGYWVHDENAYRPKYLSTNWMLLILSDLGVTKSEPGVRRACERMIDELGSKDGGFAPGGAAKGHLCTTGNAARALVKLGYVDHSRVKSAFEWMAKNRDKKGGWSCFGSGRNLDSWEALSAFAVYPRSRWTRAMEEAVELGAQLFLERELHVQGDDYPPWYRFHYPVHYYYDLLVGLDFMTALGYGSDPRMKFAIAHLKKKQRADGRFNLDAVHPDVEGGMAVWYRKKPKQAPTPFALEPPGQPSKMITLTALTVLRRLRA
jgi:hypothetical protein